MTEPSEAAKAKAREIMLGGYLEADRDRLARYIQQVSDAAKEAKAEAENGEWANAADTLDPFILPEPVDPLEAILNKIEQAAGGFHSDAEYAAALRAELTARGLKIVKDET